eukprot:TCONS_00044021-protein
MCHAVWMPQGKQPSVKPLSKISVDNKRKQPRTLSHYCVDGRTALLSQTPEVVVKNLKNDTRVKSTISVNSSNVILQAKEGRCKTWISSMEYSNGVPNGVPPKIPVRA